MKKEIFRMERVTYKENGITMLEDFNLNVMEGEIVGFIPINSFGMPSFLNLLKTNLQLEDGHIYYHEEIINSWKGGKRGNNRITVIQDQSGLVEGMTVADNIFVLRQGFRKCVIQPAVLAKQLRPVLQDIGIELSAYTYVEKLSMFERIVVSLLKGIIAGHRLIVFSEISTLISGNELRKLHEIMRHYAAQGYSFIYIGSHFEDIIQICNKTVLMSNGRIEKVLQPWEMHVKNLLTLTKEYDRMVRGYLDTKEAGTAKGEPVCEIYAEISTMMKPLHFTVCQRECLVIQCLDNHIYGEIIQILMNGSGGNSCEIRLGGKKERFSRNRNIAVIQEQCTQTMLFPELNYMDNLCFNLDKRMRNVWTKKNIRSSIYQEYTKSFGKEVFATPVDRLGEKQKYQLIYTRILLQKPKVVFCIQPFKGADVSHRMYIWELLEQLLEKEIAVVILAVNLADTLSLADRLICIDTNKEQEEYKQKDFASIPVLAPWLYLYRECVPEEILEHGEWKNRNYIQ